MYMLKVSYVDDDPEMATTKTLGTYVSLDEACEAAQSEFDAIKEHLVDLEVCLGEIEACRDNYYITYGYYDGELCRLFDGYDHYYYVSIIER